MTRLCCDVAVIGGGPAGLAAACAARQEGADRVVIIERNVELGGILPQCIHNGFGVRIFGADLTGPEYATRWIDRATDAGVEVLLDTMVLEVRGANGMLACNASLGLVDIDCAAIVACMGCRERPRGALAIPGTRPAGVYTAGTAQRLVNIEGYVPGERFVILGSGDIGMIMARRLTLEGASVEAMVEILPYVGGLRRNLVQCLMDFDVPLYLSTTVVEVLGRRHVEGVVIANVDHARRPLPGSERTIPCDGLLLSVGLIPEIELARMAAVRLDPLTGGPLVDETQETTVPGIYAAGNVLHVYDLVDDVTESALRAGTWAARRAVGATGETCGQGVRVVPGRNVRHVIPQRLRTACEGAAIEFRVRDPIEGACAVRVRVDGELAWNKRLRYARPSEMIRVDVDAQLAGAMARGKVVSVDVTRAGEEKRG